MHAAAKRLGYTASAVSQHVAALERDLGVVLFERGPRRVRPTAAGIRMAQYAIDVLDVMGEAATHSYAE